MKIIQYFTFLIFIILQSCIVNPKNYTYKTKFSLENIQKENLKNYLRTDCFYTNTKEEDYDNGKRKTFEFIPDYALEISNL